jgi:hypothetical protein
VGWIAHRQDSNRPLPQEYVKKVIPEVLAFRDKVGAQFAGTTRNKRDTDAERLASILPPITFNGQAFQVGDLQVGVQSAGKESNSGCITPWGICEVHERLRARYWPETVSADLPLEKE